MKLSWLKVALILTSLFAITACNTALKLGNVLVTVSEYRSASLEPQARLKLRFTNENVFPLAIANTDGKLYFNGTYVGKIQLKEAVGVPSLGTVYHDATLRIENVALINQLRTATAKPIAYRLDVQMVLEVDEEHEMIKTASSGEIDSASLQTAPAEPKK